MTHQQAGALAIIILLVFITGVWCGTGLGQYQERNKKRGQWK